MSISINSFLFSWQKSSKSEISKRTLCAWYVRNDVYLKVFNSCLNDNLSWKLSFLILSWFIKFSMTSKSIMTRRLCWCESISTHTFIKMWFTTSFLSTRVCKTKTMLTDFDLFSHIWDSFCWVKSSISIVHDLACHSYSRSFRFCAC
jgi:hypothetical protein